MSMIIWLIILLFAGITITRMFPAKGVTNMTVEETKNKLNDKEVQLVDVRTPSEYKSNHVKQFQNMPLAHLPKKAEKLDKDKEVIVICQSGMRSAQAAKRLKKQGFHKIYNVKGGMNAWR